MIIIAASVGGVMIVALIVVIIIVCLFFDNYANNNNSYLQIVCMLIRRPDHSENRADRRVQDQNSARRQFVFCKDPGNYFFFQ